MVSRFRTLKKAFRFAREVQKISKKALEAVLAVVNEVP